MDTKKASEPFEHYLLENIFDDFEAVRSKIRAAIGPMHKDQNPLREFAAIDVPWIWDYFTDVLKSGPKHRVLFDRVFKGYRLAPHLDSDAHIQHIFIYLSDEEGPWGTSLYTGYDSKIPVKTIPYKRNTGWILNNDNFTTFHGVETIGIPFRESLFLMVEK